MGGETYHRFLWDNPFTDPGGTVRANCVWSDLPSLFALRKPGDVSIRSVRWV